MPPTSTAQVLAEHILGEPIVPWLSDRRRQGQPDERSYHRLAADLREATGGKVDITGESVRQWLKESDSAA